MFKYQNRGISTLVAIGIIAVLIVVVGGGILAYQYYYIPKQETKNPITETPKDETSIISPAEENEMKKLVINNYLIPFITESYSYLKSDQINELANESKFYFVETKSISDSKEVVAFFVESSQALFMEKRGIIERKNNILSVVLFEDDPCYCFSQTITSRKLVSGKPNFIIVEYQPNTGTCVAAKNLVVYLISGDKFKDVGDIPIYSSTSGTGVTDLTIKFDDIDKNGNLEIIAEGVHKTCKACLGCEGPVTKTETIKKIFKWSENSQKFIESSI